MGTNPNVPQGTLNRARGSIRIPLYPFLNITAPFLGSEGFSIAPTGKSTIYIRTLTGMVRSQEPYLEFAGTIHLLRTQNLSDLYKTQMEIDSYIGDITARTDSSKLSPYLYNNVSIASVDPLKVNGTDAGYVVGLMGVYPINSNLFNQTAG